MNDNREKLMEKLHDDAHGEYIAGYITRNEIYEILDDFEKWLKTANIGDTYYWSDYSYTLEEYTENEDENEDEDENYYEPGLDNDEN